MKIHCPNCSYEGKAKKTHSAAIAFFFNFCIILPLSFVFFPLFLLFLVILIINPKSKTMCSDCGNEQVIPLKKWLKRQEARA